MECHFFIYIKKQGYLIGIFCGGMMRVCVIGGSGFIGSRLCSRLKIKNIEFRIIDKNVSHEYPELTDQADIRDLNKTRDLINGDVIINLAAEHKDDVSPKTLYKEVNVIGAENICRVAEEKNIKTIIFVSSVAIYGFTEKEADETAPINYFNEYGKTKYEAEQVYIKWQNKEPQKRILQIIRPTVVFGERNRGNVYNLLKLIHSGKFIMIGNGKNIKSMSYVENVAGFIEYSMAQSPGVYVSNYVDKPDFDMNSLVAEVTRLLGLKAKVKVSIPVFWGYSVAKGIDILAWLLQKKFSISSVRIKKFCQNTQFTSNSAEKGFKPPVSLKEGLERTVNYEFIEKREGKIFYTE